MRNSGSDYFFKNNHYWLDFDEIEKFKKIKSKIYDNTFMYVDKLLGWYNDDKVLLESFSTYVNLFSRRVVFTDKFIKKYDVKQYHIDLIRRSYIDWDDEEEDGYFCHYAVKRPYGNSSVLWDIADFYIRSENIQFKDDEENDDDAEIEDWYEENEDLLNKIHVETMTIFSHAVQELTLTSLEYKCVSKFNGVDDFQPTKNGLKSYKEKIRLKKLERIIGE